MFVFRNDSPSDQSNAAPMSRDRDLLYFWGARFVRQTFFAAIIIPFIVIADARADVSFSTVVIDPGHGGWDRGGIPGQIVPEQAPRAWRGSTSRAPTDLSAESLVAQGQMFAGNPDTVVRQIKAFRQRAVDVKISASRSPSARSRRRS